MTASIAGRLFAAIRASRPAGRRRGLWPTALLLPLTACQPGILSPAGVVGSGERTILLDSLAIMLAIVLPTIVGSLAVGWWFRGSNAQARYTPQWAHSGKVELVVWGIPALTVMLLGGVAWVSSHDLDPARPLASDVAPLEVQVVSLDWKWLFIYPAQHVAAVNELVIPAGTPVHFVLTSASVLNTFWIPQLGSMIYTMNGMSDQLNLQADRPGTFAGLSGHFSGDGFSDMHFDTRALPAAEFARWVDATRSGDGPVLDEPGYARLARQSARVAPFTFHDIDPSIYGRVVTQRIPPAAGPQGGLPSVDISNRTE